jgi:preprotein translocase subunit YajC
MLALLAAPRDGANAGMIMIIQFGAIFAILYFLLIRPQRQAMKRHRAMLEALKRGDEVMTEGGILGEVVHLKEDRVTVRTGENTRVVVARPKIARVITTSGESPPAQR